MADDNLKKFGGFVGMLSMFGAGFSNANAELSDSKFKADQLELNAQLADLQGASVIKAGDDQAVLVGKKVGQEIGASRANYAGQGVNVDSGSAAAVQSSSGVQGALAEDTIRQNAWREAWGFEVESSNYKSEAKMKRAEGEGRSWNTLLTAGANGMDQVVKGFE